jgi:uncharacterized DUF497 family protein
VGGFQHRFEWDEPKSQINRKKHDLGFETAKLVFDDPNCVMFPERIEEWEERWHAIGAIEGALIVTVVHTYRTEGIEEIIRIISARFATARKKSLYVETL